MADYSEFSDLVGDDIRMEEVYNELKIDAVNLEAFINVMENVKGAMS